MTGLIFDVNTQMLQGMKPAFKESYGMLGANSYHGDMIVEYFVVGQVTFRFFIRSNDPSINLVTRA